MRLMTKMTAVGVLALGAGACAESGGPSAPSVSLAVAPLTLPGMTDACYELTVYNKTGAPFAAEDVVWTQPSLCASDYGANGGIRFTGICDAQAPGDEHRNAIRLVLNDVFQGGDFDNGGTALSSAYTSPAGDDYVNPCPPAADGVDNGCILTAPCEENTDSKVEFNLTVMRNASLGFFDTVVKFEDIFCAAKLDCQDQDGGDLLYLPKNGVDSQTAVLGFACTAGQGAANTFLYLDDLVITCVDSNGIETRSATVDPTGGPGLLSAPALAQTGTSDVLFGASVNRGEGFQGTVYWNVLLGMNLDGVSGETCTLTTVGTASETQLVDGETPDGTRYPLIEWNVDLSSGSSRACTRHALNASGDDVQTTYSGLAAPHAFASELHAGQVARVGFDVEALYVPFHVTLDRGSEAVDGGTKTREYVEQKLAEGNPSTEDIQKMMQLLNKSLEETQANLANIDDAMAKLQADYNGWRVDYPTAQAELDAQQSAAVQRYQQIRSGLQNLRQQLEQLKVQVQQLGEPQGS